MLPQLVQLILAMLITRSDPLLQCPLENGNASRKMKWNGTKFLCPAAQHEITVRIKAANERNGETKNAEDRFINHTNVERNKPCTLDPRERHLYSSLHKI